MVGSKRVLCCILVPNAIRTSPRMVEDFVVSDGLQTKRQKTWRRLLSEDGLGRSATCGEGRLVLVWWGRNKGSSVYATV